MECQKHLFSLPDDLYYFNCARKGPLLKSAEVGAIEALKRERNPTLITMQHFFDEVMEVRGLFGQMINAKAEQIALIPAVSYGMATALSNVCPKKNGHAITIKDEFPSGYFAVERWCRQHDNHLKVIAPDDGLQLVGANWNEKILDAIDENTSLVVMSAIHWMNGVRFNLKAIGEKCRAVGAIFVVDGTQATGALPIDVEAYCIDALISASYKWLFGPYGLGLAYYGDAFREGVPLEEAWINRADSDDFSQLTNYSMEYRPNAGRFNVGEQSNFILIPILKAGLSQLLSWKVENVENYCKDLIQPLLNYLRSIDVQLESPDYFSNHLFALTLPDSVDKTLVQSLFQKNNVQVSQRGEFIRTSVNVFNKSTDIDKLIEIIEAARTAVS